MAESATTSPFRVAHATGEAGSGSHWSDLTRRALADLGELRTTQGLGLVYVTDHLAAHFSEIVDHLRLRTGLRDWVGTSGIGVVGHDGHVPHEHFDRPAMALMVADLPPDAFRLFQQQESGAGRFTKQHAKWIESHGAQLGLVHADPRNPQLAALLETLAEASGLYLVGGLASSRNVYPIAAETVAEGGIGGAIFAGDIGIATGLSQGCSPIGPVHTVTECDRNILKTIDDKPALDIFKAEIGDVLSRNLERVAGYIFAALPVKGSDTGDYLVRSLVGIDPGKGWIAIGDVVEPGDAIMFVRRDRASAEADLNRMLDRLKGRVDRPIRGGVYVSCVSRGVNLFGSDSAETRRIAGKLGAFPLVGFFANGEISHRRLYGHTGVLTLFY
jgi:small ligand-binding sensory domain FIST